MFQEINPEAGIVDNVLAARDPQQLGSSWLHHIAYFTDIERTITRTRAIQEEARTAGTQDDNDDIDDGVDDNAAPVEQEPLGKISDYTEKLHEASKVAEMLIAQAEELERQLRLAEVDQDGTV